MLDPLAQRYGWTLDYIMWGLSWVNINMLLIDIIDTVDEKNTTMSGDDKQNVEEFIRTYSR